MKLPKSKELINKLEKELPRLYEEESKRLMEVIEIIKEKERTRIKEELIKEIEKSVTINEFQIKAFVDFVKEVCK